MEKYINYMLRNNMGGKNMGKIVYITGGARSGKSSFAQQKAFQFHPNVVYIATAIPIDGELEDRIQKHRSARPRECQTIEIYKDMGGAIQMIDKDMEAIIIDCLTIMVSNLMLEQDLSWDNMKARQIDELEGYIVSQVVELIGAIESSHLTAFIVSNELGMGLVPPYPLGRIFRDIAGRINQLVAKQSDEAYFLVSGLPVKLR